MLNLIRARAASGLVICSKAIIFTSVLSGAAVGALTLLPSSDQMPYCRIKDYENMRDPHHQINLGSIAAYAAVPMLSLMGSIAGGIIGLLSGVVAQLPISGLELLIRPTNANPVNANIALQYMAA